MSLRICIKCMNQFHTDDSNRSICDDCLRIAKPLILTHFNPELERAYPKQVSEPEEEPEEPVAIKPRIHKPVEKKRNPNRKSVYVGLRLTPQEVEPIASMNMSKVIRRALKHYVEKHLNKQNETDNNLS